jgi:hypothetical protein
MVKECNGEKGDNLIKIPCIQILSTKAKPPCIINMHLIFF